MKKHLCSTTIHTNGTFTSAPALINFSRSKFRPRREEYVVYLKKRYPDLQVIDVTQTVWNEDKYPKNGYTLVINSATMELYNLTGELVQKKRGVLQQSIDIAENPDFNRIINKILGKSNPIYLLKYMNKFTFPFEDNPAVFNISPDLGIVDFWASKLNQYRMFSKLGIPIADFKIIHSEEKFWRTVENFGFSVFVSKDRGSSGSGKFLASTREEIERELKKFEETLKEGTELFENLIICKRLDVFISPSVGAITDGETTIVGGISEQILKNGVSFRGNRWPLSKEISTENIKEIIEITKVIGKEIGKPREGISDKGYKGIFNIDFIITPNGKIYFAEINPRNFGHYPQINKTIKYVVKWTNFAELDLWVNEGRTFDEFPGLCASEFESKMCYEPHGCELAWVLKEFSNPNRDLKFTEDIGNFPLEEIMEKRMMGTFDFPGTGIKILKKDPAFHVFIVGENREEAEKKSNNDIFFSTFFEKHGLICD